MDITQNAGLDEAQAGVKTAGRNIYNLRYADDTTRYGRKWRRTKEPLDEGERGEWEKIGLKLKTMKIMASCPITSWQIDGKRMETITDFIFLVSKITADGDCNHEIKGACSLEEKLWQI